MLRDLDKLVVFPRYKHSNLSHEEYLALKTLSEDPSITFKATDQGDKIGILNRQDCEVNHQLQYLNFYSPSSNNLTKHIINIITVQKASELGYIDESPAQFLIRFHPQVLVFYILLKIHKKPPPQEIYNFQFRIQSRIFRYILVFFCNPL